VHNLEDSRFGLVSAGVIRPLGDTAANEKDVKRFEQPEIRRYPTGIGGAVTVGVRLHLPARVGDPQIGIPTNHPI